MSLAAALLVIFSALLHAGWNIIGKSHQGSGSAFFIASTSSAAILLSPYIIWFALSADLSALSGEFWWLVLLSGVFQAIYVLGLAKAYKQSDIGVIYPIARALPVLMVGVGTLLWFEQTLEPKQWFGFVLLTIGCLLVPLERFRQFQWTHYANWGVFWALIAAIGTTGYSILDKAALEILQSHQFHHDVHNSVFFLAVQFWSLSFMLGLYLVIMEPKAVFTQAWCVKRRATLAGTMMGLTYCLVLFAMTMTENVSLIVALRQISIVFGLLLGVLILKERWMMTRGVGVALIVVGLITALT
ncbi:EamA family transporter [Vibrio sp. SCSIO 43136]|uniref:EamA family transporter n=1 Tax=Vibrio sp. SCSIO 43136 TaxID=2819101 RepID=UPI0020762A5A|nr:EamA family transporter [Vibrio sp. SCSIO 43136]USD67697.1 EamA family transporter [Vibrio sp. SCSIO 43136]